MDIPGDSKNDAFEMSGVTLENPPVAYVRPVSNGRGIGYAVCSADGTQLALFASRDAAYFAAKQHDLEPVLIH